MKPIIFSTEMVQAILEGRKTKTRRLVKYSKKITDEIIGFSCFTPEGHFSVRGRHENGDYGESFFKCKYSVGDILYVREAFCPGYFDDGQHAYKAGWNKTGECKPSTNPTATFTAGGINHAALFPPFQVIARGQSKTKPITDPATTQTSMINMGIVTPEAWSSFISNFYGNGATNNHITDAISTVRTKESQLLVNFQEPRYEDCFYRMLMPHEIQAAMAFGQDYVVLGSGKDKVKQLGNAVTPPVMEWLVDRCVQSLEI